MSINTDQLDYLAKLSMLLLNETQKKHLHADLNDILQLVESLKNINTTDVEPVLNPLDATLTLRDDKVTEENNREFYQETASLSDNGLYLVPKVIE